MKWVKRIGGALAALVVLGALAAGGVWLWAKHRVNTVFAKTWKTHQVDFPVPFPLSDAEIAALRAEKGTALANADPSAAKEGAADAADPLAGVDLKAIALQRAVARGKHYATAIYVCVNCHGSDFTGAAMIDDPMFGKIQGPDITRAGVTKDFTPADWDRAVRHGVLPGGHTSIMPVRDFADMSDHELSDLVAYIDSLPPKPGPERIRHFGPMGTLLVATGKLVPDVYKVPDHFADHPKEPPPIGPTAEYGKHLAGICSGCHRATFNGGPIPGAPPNWPPALNLTPSKDGLAGWTFADFQKAFQRGIKPDGTPLKDPMSEMLQYTPNWSDTEMHAMWAFLQSLPATPTGT